MDADVTRAEIGPLKKRLRATWMAAGARAIWSVLAAAILIAAGPAIQTATAQEKLPSLYERLGGVYSIATVVDDFIERLLVNATLNANPAISEARARVPKAGLKFHVTALCAR